MLDDNFSMAGAYCIIKEGILLADVKTGSSRRRRRASVEIASSSQEKLYHARVSHMHVTHTYA